jgi:hypothetical protein
MSYFLAANKRVFRRPLYAILAVCTAALFLVFSVWLPNLSFMASTITTSHYSLPQKVGILLSSLAALNSNFTPLSRTLTITLALLLGVDVAFLAFYMRTRFRLGRSAGMSIGGLIAGLLGIGCASCGSVVVASFLGAGASAGFLNILPLKGQEFGFLGIALILAGIFFTARKIEQPMTCGIRPAPRNAQPGSGISQRSA